MLVNYGPSLTRRAIRGSRSLAYASGYQGWFINVCLQGGGSGGHGGRVHQREQGEREQCDDPRDCEAGFVRQRQIVSQPSGQENGAVLMR